MYAQDYVENDVLNQDPVELVCRLYSKAIEKLNQAREHFDDERIEERAAAIAHASEIILELQAALNLEKGGEIAKNLAQLYDYIQERLAEANGRQDPEAVEEARRLIATLYEGWQECRPSIALPEADVTEEMQLAAAGRAWTL